MSLQQPYRRPATVTKPDDDSDTEECNVELRKAEARESQIIHSGHFMVSSPHCEHPPKKGYDFDTVNKQTCQTYHFGKASTSQFSIDASLTKLFECMTLAYSGKLVSPKWKNFKGLKLLWRDKIRLNNAIWRAWYMQYVERRKNPVCHFVTPLDGNTDLDVHRPEGIITEGKCWKRRIEIVIREYHKWRTYFKKRLHKHKDDDLSSLLKGKQEQLLLFGEVSPDMLRVSLNQDEDCALRRVPRKYAETPTPMEMDNLFDMDVLMSEFSDTLFSTLASHQPMAWPNPREIAHAGNADMIQPGLIPLQPNLDFMDSFDPLQDLFHSLRQPVFPSVSLTASSVTPLSGSSSQSQGQLISSMQLTSNHISPSGPLPLPPSIVGPTTQAVGGGGGGGSGSADNSAFVQNYMPMFPGHVVRDDTPQQMSHDHLVQCLPDQDMITAAPLMASSLDNSSVLDEAVAPSVITHTASSVVTHSDAATTICQGSEFNSMSIQPPPSKLQNLTSLHPAPGQPSFAVPRLPQPSSATTSRPQRIAPANHLPPSHLVYTGPFPGHGNTLIVTPPLKADDVPNSGVVMASTHLGGAPGFQKSIVSNQMSCSSNQRTSQMSSNIASNQPPPGSGPSCVLDQIPSPQSLINSSTSLVKSEQNQPAPSQLQTLTPLHPAPQQPFALPRPLQPSSANKNRSVQRMGGTANPLPPTQLVFTGPFPGPSNALIALKADDVPNPGMVISPFYLGGAPGFQVVPQKQKSPQLLVPKQKSCSNRRSPKISSSIASNEPPTGSGPSCVLDQIPSPQSLINSSSSLVKSEQNQTRRTKHISAEQKRRSNINIGFETLCKLVPTLKSQANISNAVTLQKTVEHIGKLQQERQQMQEEVRRLREEIEQLKNSIGFCQKQLPATGVPVRMNHLNQTQEQFNEYVKNRTLQNWKFWIFSIILKPLFESFNGMVSTTSREELYQTTLQWLDRHCSLPVLRPMVLNSLCQLSTTTAILSDPSSLPEEAVQAVSQM